MTTAAPRNYVRLGAAIVIAAVVIGAGIFATTLFVTPSTAPQSVGTAPTVATSCSPTGDLAAPRRFAFNVAVNYTGRWNATAEGYSGSTPAFIDCYTGNGLGYIYLSDWNQGGGATLQVVAEKADSSNGNLTISITFGATNSMTEKNSTSLPEGSAGITATILRNAAVVSNLTTTIVSTNASTSSVRVVGGPFMFLTASGICTANATYVPCLGGPAYVFNCTAIQSFVAGPPSESEGCVQKVTSTMAPYPSANVTITIFAAAPSGAPSWANCQWSVAGTPESDNDAYCIPINSSSSTSVSFIVGEPAPPPP